MGSEGPAWTWRLLPKAWRRSIEKNATAIWVEIRQTGELSVLLSRRMRGQVLSQAERQKVREQLLDVAKAIPAAAIFAAPGGLVLLVLLARVLPFSLLPSAFREAQRPDAGPSDEPPRDF